MKALREHKGLWWLVLVWMTGFAVLRVIQHLTLNTNGQDLSLFDYAIANTADGRFMQTIFRNPHLFGHHFSPILLLLVPLYWIHNGPMTLLLFQVAAVGASAVPFYFIAQWKFNDARVALLLTVSYLLYRKLTMGLMYDFHMEMMEPLFIFSAFWFAVQKRWGWYFAFLVLAMACKEDVALYLVPLGLFLVWRFQEKRVGWGTVGVCAVWFGVAAGWAVPHYHSAGLPHYFEEVFYGNLGSGLGEVVVSLVTHPARVLGEVLDPLSLRGLFNTFGAVLFLPLFAPASCLLTAVPLFVNLVSSSPLQKSLAIYYATPVIPFLFISMVYGLHNLHVKFLKGHKRRLVQVCVALLVVSVANSALWNYLSPAKLKITRHHTLARQMAKSIPPEVSLSAQGSLIPHIQRRAAIKQFPEQWRQAQYVALDTRGNTFPLGEQEYQIELSHLKSHERYDLVYEEDGVLLFQRKQKAGINDTAPGPSQDP